MNSRKLLAIFLLALLAPAASALASEQGAIARLLESAARAMSELPKSRDRAAVLRHYAKEYTGTTDGEAQTRESLESVVVEIDENVEAGNPVSITNRVSGVDAHPQGKTAWATWKAYSRIEVLEEVLGEVERRCTGVFEKGADGWRIRHEHCSAPWRGSIPEVPADDDSAMSGEDRKIA